jgi:hypothetical protein
MLRAELEAIVEQLLTTSEQGAELSLDALGEAIGTRAVSPPEIQAMIDAVEARGRRFAVAKNAGQGENYLRSVVSAARTMANTLGRAPTVSEIAAHTGLPLADVKHALSLLQIMQR